MALGASFSSVFEAARLGVEWAWALLYRDLAPAVLGYLRASGAAEPEDLTGEVFLAVVRDLDRFEGEEAGFRSWVFTIAHHRALVERRRRARRPSEPAPGGIIEQYAGVGNAEDDAVERLSAEGVARTLGRLSPDQRDVLLLRLVAGLTVDEAARVLGKQPGAVKALQRRGLAAIRREMTRDPVPL